MDRELIAYLDRKFTENEEATRRAVEGLGKELREDLGGQIRELREDLGDLRETTTRLESETREAHIRIERHVGTHKLLAEAIADLSAKVDRHHEENAKAREEDRALWGAVILDVKGRLDDHDSRLGNCEARATRLESAGT